MSSRLRSIEWHKACLRKYGVTYTDPQVVYKDLIEFVHVSNVLGRIETANELESRVTIELCQKYAPLLHVLLLLSSHDGSDDVTDKILEDSGEEYDFGDSQSLGEISEISELSEESESELVTSDTSVTIPDFKQKTSDEIAPLLRVKYQTTIFLEPEQSHRCMVNDLVLMLHGYTIPECGVKNLSKTCSEDVNRMFHKIRVRLYDLPQRIRNEILAEIRNAGCATVIQLLLSCEKHLLNPPSFIVNTNLINTWLSGALTLPITLGLDEKFFEFLPANQNPDTVLEDWMGGKTELDSVVLEAYGLSSQLHHPRLLESVLLGSIASNVFDLTLNPEISFKSSDEYARDMYNWYYNVKTSIYESGLKESIIKTWDYFSSIYLVQDPRVLNFFHEWLTKSDGISWYVATETLIETWPDCPFELNFDLMPIISIELHPYIESWLGTNYSRIFSSEELGRLWLKAIDGFRNGDQVVELELADICKRVRSKLLENCTKKAL